MSLPGIKGSPSSQSTSSLTTKSKTQREIREEYEAKLKADEELALSMQGEEWFCHCCTAKNRGGTKCRVCGRGEDYVNKGFPFPLHGYGSQIFRPSQVSKVVTNVYDADEEGWTPLHSVAASGNLGLVEELLRLESEVDSLTENNETPLHLAVYCGSLDCVQVLLKHGADIAARTAFERKQPIHFACEKGWSKLMHYLLKHGGDVNSKDATERTPLHYVSLIGRVDMAADLLKLGANAGALDAGGWTARQMAELNSHRETVELLCRAGMSEKMPVIKELPPAPWHGESWDNLTDLQMTRTIRVQKLKEQDLALKTKLDQLRKERAERELKKTNVLGERRESEPKAPVMVSLAAFKRRKKPGDSDTDSASEGSYSARSDRSQSSSSNRTNPLAQFSKMSSLGNKTPPKKW